MFQKNTESMETVTKTVLERCDKKYMDSPLFLGRFLKTPNGYLGRSIRGAGRIVHKKGTGET